jgi:putative redox protein
MPRITAKLSSGLVVRISNGRHDWGADEPVSVGGTDTGPNPYELLLGSLAACTCITIAGYCKHKGLALDSVSTSYNFARIHADDCENCDDDATGMIDHITSNVHIEGDFDDAQRERLAYIATRCPVHKTLTNRVHIEDNATFGREGDGN